MLSLTTPTVNSLDACDRLFLNLILIRAAEGEDQAEADRETQAITDRIKARQLVEVGAETLTYKEYREKAEAAILAFAGENAKAVLAGVDGQTRKFTHGSISYRALPPILEDIDGAAKTTNEKFIASVKGMGQGGLVGAIGRWLAQFKLVKEIAAAEIFRVKVEIDRGAVLRLATAKTLSAAWLKARNLKLVKDQVAISYKLAEQTVRSEQTTPVEPPAKLAA